MTIPVNDRKAPVYVGNGATTNFAYDFHISADTELLVYLLDNTTNTATLQTLTTHYTVTGVGDAGGGDVVFVTEPTSDENVFIIGNTPQAQTVEYPTQGTYHADILEDSLDKLTKIVAELQAKVDRCLKISITDTPDGSEEFDPANGADSTLVRDADGGFRFDKFYEPVWSGFSVVAPSGGYPTSYNPNTATLGDTMDMVASILNTLKGP